VQLGRLLKFLKLFRLMDFISSHMGMRGEVGVIGLQSQMIREIKQKS
jgi:hypothetical protein